MKAARRSTLAEWHHARELVNEHGENATAYQILNPGIERWLKPNAVVGYVTAAGYRVVAGAPICAEDDLAAVVEAFENDSHRQSLRTCYFAADDRLAETLAWRGPYDRILLGSQPVWNPAHWPVILDRKASLRAQLYRARNKGVHVRHVPVEEAARDPRLESCLAAWLETRGLPPLHFLVEPATLGRLHDREVFIAQKQQEVVGFLVASPIPRRNGWLVEQNIRAPNAPNGTTELLLTAAMMHLAEQGAEVVTLGLSPLSRRSCITAEHVWWIRLLWPWIRAHGKRFYNFEGLDNFKAKFLPERWEPIWAITSAGRVSPRTLYAIAEAFGRMPPPLLVARTLGRAVGQEARWLRRRLGL